jgi:hypothetical protein
MVPPLIERPTALASFLVDYLAHSGELRLFRQCWGYRQTKPQAHRDAPNHRGENATLDIISEHPGTTDLG